MEKRKSSCLSIRKAYTGVRYKKEALPTGSIACPKKLHMEQRDTQQNTPSSNGQSIATAAKNAFYHKHLAVSVISKKTEKIATAIYMVTDFVPESEPLRTQLRTLGLALVSGTRKIGARSTEPHYALADEVVRTIDETVVFVNLASTIGLISEMNGKVLVSELEKVKAEIDHHYGGKNVLFDTHPGYANILLTPAMFEVEPAEKILGVFDKGQDFLKGQNQEKPTPVNQPEAIISQKDFSAKKTDIGIKIARRNDVLNVVRSKGRVSIKDVLLILKDMSEKTVQRELLALVREGVLVKEGEKRWSMYRIAS